ncbi:MAG: hypothetical protein JSS00_10975 [Proteobacteria bacterium]|nr:hypothetical protein [Pseudomonadota bacterium]
MRIVGLAALLGLAACGTTGMSSPGQPGTPGYPGQQPSPVPLPTNGPIAYTCSDGTQLTVDVEGSQARVAIIGGPSMVLPNTGNGAYSNGRYSFTGGGASGQWAVGSAAPVECRGS